MLEACCQRQLLPAARRKAAFVQKLLEQRTPGHANFCCPTCRRGDGCHRAKSMCLAHTRATHVLTSSVAERCKSPGAFALTKSHMRYALILMTCARGEQVSNQSAHVTELAVASCIM